MSVFHLKIFSFLEVKFTIYLNRCVFVMAFGSFIHSSCFVYIQERLEIGFYMWNKDKWIVFSSPEPKDQDGLLLSLAGWGPSIHPATPLNDFSSETPGTIFFKFRVEPSVKGGLKICTNAHGLYLKWPLAAYMVKTLKNSFLQNQESFEAEPWYIAFGAHRTKKALRLNLGI